MSIGLVQIKERSRGTRATRLTFNPPVVCPAGTPVFETKRGSGCRCQIERNTLTAQEDPNSLTAFCFGEYQTCTSWQQNKAWIEEGFRGHVTDDRRGQVDTRSYREDLIEMDREVEVTHYLPEE